MKRNKLVIISLILVLVFLFINMISTITTTIDYEKRKESGNDRWKQVEERMLQAENKVNTLEKEIEQWKK